MTNFLQRVLAIVLGLILTVAALVFASAVLALAAALALVSGGWLWWRTRRLRRAAAHAEAVVIEGEYRVERETRYIERDRS